LGLEGFFVARVLLLPRHAEAPGVFAVELGPSSPPRLGDQGGPRRGGSQAGGGLQRSQPVEGGVVPADLGDHPAAFLLPATAALRPRSAAPPAYPISAFSARSTVRGPRRRRRTPVLCSRRATRWVSSIGTIAQSANSAHSSSHPISSWDQAGASSCSSRPSCPVRVRAASHCWIPAPAKGDKIGRASCRE